MTENEQRAHDIAMLIISSTENGRRVVVNCIDENDKVTTASLMRLYNNILGEVMKSLK